MRKIIFIVIVSMILYGFFYIRSMNETKELSKNKENIDSQEKTISEVNHKLISKSTIFVPYWNIPTAQEFSSYDELVYFGVAPNEDGSLKPDVGKSNIDKFIRSTPSQKERLLTLRMLDTETNISILENNNLQEKVIRETLAAVDEYGFDGVVLDLEMSVIPFSDTQKEITTFVKRFSDKTKEKKLTLKMTIYGDTFYRGRPYDVLSIGKMVDGIMIMAYDFHKSRGEPGQNFPFNRDNEYDFQSMIEDFSQEVDVEKISIIFGMYGYDWTLGEQGLPLKAAKAIPLHEIEDGIVSVCTSSNTIYRNCSIQEDKVSSEKKITYTDSEGFGHVLYYEDRESVDVKIEFLESQGIEGVGYWVWGYF